LNLRCPRCRTTFADFEGCFALTCAVNSCRAGICAWCLKDCGGDAHQHVLTCTESKRPGTYYGTLDEFNEHHRVRRMRDVQTAIKEESPEVRRILKSLLKKDLADLSITLTDDDEAKGAGAVNPPITFGFFHALGF